MKIKCIIASSILSVAITASGAALGMAIAIYLEWQPNIPPMVVTSLNIAATTMLILNVVNMYKMLVNKCEQNIGRR